VNYLGVGVSVDGVSRYPYNNLQSEKNHEDALVVFPILCCLGVTVIVVICLAWSPTSLSVMDAFFCELPCWCGHLLGYVSEDERYCRSNIMARFRKFAVRRLSIARLSPIREVIPSSLAPNENLTVGNC
jgi:hypothetical protein